MAELLNFQGLRVNFDKAGYYFILLLILAVIGFWESYFSNLLSGIDSYIHFHAITMLIWIAMLITQAFLIRYKKRSLHKIIGNIRNITRSLYRVIFL